ncbi:MAG: sodium:alanine symporter family protein [Clostridia bacterium]|nr:sodium:alanine symporter family protein [Clostridia bacterium]
MLEFINSVIIGSVLPVFLIGTGLFFIIYMNGLPLLRPLAIIAPFLKNESNGRGNVRPRSALWLALGGVLGVGNIVGVSSAIFFGGAGAVFWMCASAAIAAILKYAETLLALSRRKKNHPSCTSDYIKDSLAERRHPHIGAFLGVIFAILCLVNSLSLGCIIQVNAMVGVCDDILNIDPLIVGSVCALLMIVVSSGGLKRISAATSRIVPFMTILFCFLSIAALIIRSERIPNAIAEIIESAFDFSSSSIFGGVGGFFISKSVRLGVMRGLISNEAGAGTSPMAHSTSSTDSPVEQGFLGIIEVLIDTVFLCTLTALVILVSYPEVERFGDNSVMMTVSAYSEALGDWADPVMCGLVLLFGLATVFCQCFYGQECLSYLTKSKAAKVLLTVAYGTAAIVASRTPPGSVWGLADLSIGIMTLINISVLILERQRIRKETMNYFIN